MSKENPLSIYLWLQYYKLKPLLPLFSGCKNKYKLCMRFCQINTTKVVQSCPMPSKWGDFEQREMLWLEKLSQISLARTVAICDMHKSSRCFYLHIPGHVG